MISNQSYKAEAACSAWKLGRTLKALGGDENDQESEKLLKKAMSLRKGLDPENKWKEPELVLMTGKSLSTTSIVNRVGINK